jgi:hypothetical protein
MLAEFIQKIADLAKLSLVPQTLSVDGLTYTSGANPIKRVPFPAAAALELSTLDGVLAYLDGNRDELDLKSVTVIVDSPAHLSVMGELLLDRTREVFIGAKPIEGDALAGFLNRYQPVEEFIVGVQRLFRPDLIEGGPRDRLLKVVGNLSAGDVRTLVDDGVSQEVSIKAGIKREASTVVENPVLLCPRRSFPEIDLDPVPFVLRLRAGGDGGLPTVALHEADGGMWKLDAIRKVQTYLATKWAASHEAARPWGIVA